MGREHINVRLTTEVLQGVEAYAEQNKTSRSAAVEKLLSIALEAGQQTSEQEQIAAGELETLRDYVSTLKEQIAVKDGQISQLTQLADQAQQLQARITMTLPIAQESGHDGPGAARDSHTSPQDAPQAPQTATQGQDSGQGATRSWWARLWSKEN